MPGEERALPEDIGLPVAPSQAAGAAFRDEADEPYALSTPSPFSGASPDAARTDVRREPTAAVVDPAGLDPGSSQQAAAAVAAAVRAVLAGDVTAVDRELLPLGDRTTETRGASSLAAHALAARLPSLSGVSGDVVFDEPADELLHAYADLLSERAESLRRTIAPGLRDEISAVAHLAADVAAQEAEDDLADSQSVGHVPADHRADADVQPLAEVPLADAQVNPPQVALARSSAPPRLVLPGLAPRQQLLATCVLLAQTCRDGGGDVDALAAELGDLVHETPPG